MLRDPLTAYVSRHGGVENRLIELAESKYEPSTAEDAFNQFVEAAMAGSSFAMCICSRLLREGRGTSQSAEQALLWAERAAHTGFAPGVYELARCYEYGVGVDPDVRKAGAAVLWYERASELGDPFASVRLQFAYSIGQLGLPKNPELARQYEELSKQQITWK